MMTAVPVASPGRGRKAASAGVTTFRTTVPTGVFSTVRSWWVQDSDPGAGPGQMLTVWAWR